MDRHERRPIWACDRSSDLTAISDEAKQTEPNRGAALASSHVRPPRDEAFVSVPDCCALDTLDDTNILRNLAQRYASDDIYTYTGTVLLAVNPHKPLAHLYSDEVRKIYCDVQNAQKMPPHPYFLADSAFRRMLRDRKDQTIMVSGESGAGKTETAKIVIDFLVKRAKTAQKPCVANEELNTNRQQKIIEGANNILESFGNATTVRNNNSSRFGKYNVLRFDAMGGFLGASINTYLLESNRVVAFGEKERTYHVFYEMLHHPIFEQYELVLGGDPTRDDAHNLTRLLTGFANVGFSTDFVNNTLKLLAGIVHLCHVTFANSDDDVCDVDWETSETSVTLAAENLGLDEGDMIQRLLFRKVVVRKHRRHSVFEVRRDANQATNAKHALIKTLYTRLFDLLVRDMNGALGGTRECDGQHIGILDIYGFEQLEVNSFEQLCINFANERLHHFFVHNVLIAEQDCYKSEGLPWEDVKTPDNGPAVDAISHILSLLDNQSILASRNQKTNDIKFTEDVYRQHGHSTVVRQPRRGRGAKGSTIDVKEGFVIKHYAGDVTYLTNGWIEKNNARLTSELECLTRDSINPVVGSLADPLGCGLGCASFTSVGKKYVEDSSALLQTLQACDLHYIRCFKPNGNQEPDHFDSQVVTEQMVQSGTIKLVQVMHAGYPYRCSFDILKERLLRQLPQEFHHEDPLMFLNAVMFALGVNRCDWALGVSRVFMKSGKLCCLEDMNQALSNDLICRLRCYMARKKLRRCLHAIALCRWMHRCVQRARRERFLRFIHVAARLHARVKRWLQVARFTLRQRKIDNTCVKLLHCVRIRIRMNRSLQMARLNLRQKRIDDNCSKLKRCVCIRVRMTRWLQVARMTLHQNQIKTRRGFLLRFMYVAARLRARSNRWLQVARINLRQKQIDYTCSKLQRCARIRVRITRWLQTAQMTLRQKQIDDNCSKLQHCACIRVRMNRWLQVARMNLRQKQTDNDSVNLKVTAKQVLNMRRWIRRAQHRIRVQKLIVAFARIGVFAIHLRAHQRRWVANKRTRDEHQSHSGREWEHVLSIHQRRHRCIDVRASQAAFLVDDAASPHELRHPSRKRRRHFEEPCCHAEADLSFADAAPRRSLLLDIPLGGVTTQGGALSPVATDTGKHDIGRGVSLICNTWSGESVRRESSGSHAPRGARLYPWEAPQLAAVSLRDKSQHECTPHEHGVETRASVPQTEAPSDATERDDPSIRRRGIAARPLGRRTSPADTIYAVDAASCVNPTGAPCPRRARQEACEVQRCAWNYMSEDTARRYAPSTIALKPKLIASDRACMLSPESAVSVQAPSPALVRTRQAVGRETQIALKTMNVAHTERHASSPVANEEETSDRSLFTRAPAPFSELALSPGSVQSGYTRSPAPKRTRQAMVWATRIALSLAADSEDESEVKRKRQRLPQPFNSDAEALALSACAQLSCSNELSARPQAPQKTPLLCSNLPSLHAHSRQRSPLLFSNLPSLRGQSRQKSP